MVTGYICYLSTMTKAEVRQMLKHAPRDQFRIDYYTVHRFSLNNQCKTCDLCGGPFYEAIETEYETRYYGYTYNNCMICVDCYNRDPDQPIPSRCQHCSMTFDSRNKLFEHLKQVHNLVYGQERRGSFATEERMIPRVWQETRRGPEVMDCSCEDMDCD